MADLVLVVDDDPDIRSVVEITLELAGFEVVTAADGTSGYEQALQHRPDAVLLDIMMPDLNGYEVMQRLRGDGRLSHVPVIMLTAKAQLEDKIAGLDHGADDYITKPFDTDELVARVQAALRRARATRSVSPLTGLPANVRIEQELARRVDAEEPIAVLYADLNYFKAFNDRYGFLRGDKAIRTLADILRDVATTRGGPRTFLGHIGGDDFVVLANPDDAEAIARDIVDAFDEAILDHYDPEDREAGFIEVEDRTGALHRYPHLSVSIGIVTNLQRTFEDHRELVEVATEMKNYAKRLSGGVSNYFTDRRTDE